MKYRFENNGVVLEVYHDDSLVLDVSSSSSEIYLSLDRDDLYDLIGALHVIQSKLNTYYNDTKGGNKS